MTNYEKKLGNNILEARCSRLKIVQFIQFTSFETEPNEKKPGNVSRRVLPNPNFAKMPKMIPAKIVMKV